MQEPVIFFVGAGNMGGAIIKGLRAANYSAEKILFFEPNDSCAKNFASLGIQRVQSFKEGYTKASVLLLCVKPQIFSKLPEQWKKNLRQLTQFQK